MLKTKRERVLVKPNMVEPSSPKLEVMGTLNPAAMRLPDGKIVLYVRVLERLKKHFDEKYFYSPRWIGEKNYKLTLDKSKRDEVEGSSEMDISFSDGTKRFSFISHLRRVVLDSSGFKILSIDEKPTFYGYWWDGELGIEDPRITKLNDLYLMTYVGLSRDGNVSTNLAISNDCKSWYRKGIIFTHQNKDVVLFPERIDQKYVAFIRPEGSFGFSSPHIWISYSDNLDFWGDSKSFPLTKKKSSWDSGRVGAGPPPLKTDKGWLFVYHGVEDEKNRAVYSAGVALLDLKNPKKILAKSVKPLIVPTNKYEKGTFENKDVVFPTGLVLDKNEKDVLIFSGGGDINTTVKKFSLNEIFKNLKKF